MTDIRELARSIDLYRCLDDFMTLESKFNQIGMTIQRTVGNNVILCKIVNNRPQANNLLEDYVFICKNRNNALDENRIRLIQKFILENADDPSFIQNRDHTDFGGMNIRFGKIFIAGRRYQKHSTRYIMAYDLI